MVSANHTKNHTMHLKEKVYQNYSGISNSSFRLVSINRIAQVGVYYLVCTKLEAGHKVLKSYMSFLSADCSFETAGRALLMSLPVNICPLKMVLWQRCAHLYWFTF